jgi:beta-lactamase regulating signal transducer with metallopeptidase domain
MARAGQGGITGVAVINLLWLVGGVGLGSYSPIGVVWLMRVRRQAVPIDVADLLPVTEQYHEALQVLPERVDVRLTTRIVEPCIYGFFRPVILLPTWRLEDNTPPNLEYILLHEGLHYRGRDH